MPHYIKVQAVNIDDIIGETEQLSIIRGTSLTMLRVADILQDVAESAEKLELLAEFSSAAVYCAPPDCDLNQVIETLRVGLATNTKTRYLRYCVAATTASNVVEASIALDNQISRDRLREPTIAPDFVESGKAHLVSSFSPARIATISESFYSGNDKVTYHFSEAEHCFFQTGREARAEFAKVFELNEFEDTLERGDIGFAQSFQQISKSDVFEKLNGKIALLSFDGNEFGKYLQQCNSDDEYQKLVNQIKANRNRFIKSIWQYYLNAFGTKDEHKFFIPVEQWVSGKKTIINAMRFECLVWGADEITIVVPAWLGWEILHQFYANDWSLEGHIPTHAGAMVYCRAKTPTRRILALADDMLDKIKESPGGRKKDLFSYTVLESIDFPTESLDDFYGKIYSKKLAEQRLPLVPQTPCDLASVTELRKLSTQLPKTRLYRAAQEIIYACKIHRGLTPTRFKGELDLVINTLRNHLSELDNDWFERFFSELQQSIQIQIVQANETSLNELWLWVHVLELWDYLLLSDGGYDMEAID